MKTKLTNEQFSEIEFSLNCLNRYDLNLNQAYDSFFEKYEEPNGKYLRHPASIGYIIDEIADCMVTFEDAKKELESIESELAKQLNLHPYIRPRIQLWDLCKTDDFEETSLVRDWHESYSSYVNWLEDNIIGAEVITRHADKKYNDWWGKITVHVSNHSGKYKPYRNLYCIKNMRLNTGEEYIFNNYEVIFL